MLIQWVCSVLIIYYFWNNNFYWMLQGMGIVYFACESFHSNVALFLSSLDENYKSKNLLAKEENVLTFLSLAFFKL